MYRVLLALFVMLAALVALDAVRPHDGADGVVSGEVPGQRAVTQGAVAASDDRHGSL